jgi:hypothetical protein
MHDKTFGGIYIMKRIVRWRKTRMNAKGFFNKEFPDFCVKWIV